jgi:hypothetical protein
VYGLHIFALLDPQRSRNIHTQGYVGITKDLARRLKEHNRRPNFLQGRTVEVVLQGDKSFCRKLEAELRPKRNIGLNIAEGGGMPPNVSGIRRSIETRKKLAANNVGFRGRKHSDETKLKMWLAHQKLGGKPHTEETKQKLREIAKNRTYENGMKGRRHAEKTRRLIGEKAKARFSAL